ncbi:MAG: phosphotransferase [Myxococcota bacterium]|nr:phosphotransferase [Myxococcota bacterium]
MSEPGIPASPDAVDADWLTACLRHGGDPAARVVDFDATDVGTGQVGRNVRFALQLEGASEATPGSLVAKFPSDDPVSRATGVAQGNYLREVRFYRELVHTVDIRTPACHYAAFDPDTSNFVLVMEDMAPAVQGDQIRGCDVDQAALALSELAALHAPRWNDPALGEIAWLQRGSEDSANLLQVLYGSVLGGFRERYEARLDAEAIALIQDFAPKAGAFVRAGFKGPRAVTHGDYRLDNMLFGEGSGAAPLAVVDWQTPGLGHPAGDASYFLGAGLLPEDRREHERALLAHYHRELEKRGVSGYDLETLHADYRTFAFGGVVMAVVASMIVGQSKRGDDMFMAMASRHCAHAIDWDSLAAIPD